jgi:mRNA interferase RelE/StbE
MSYKLRFLPSALKEWKKLDQMIKQQFKKKLEERLVNPHITSAQLFGY